MKLLTAMTVRRETLECWQTWEARAAAATLFLNGRPHEAFGDELSRCHNPGVDEGVKGVENLETPGRRDIWTRISRRRIALQLDLCTWDGNFDDL